MVTHIQELVQSHPAVMRLKRPLSVHLGPHEVFLALDVQFQPNLRAAELVGVVDELEKKIHQAHRNVGQIFIEVESLEQTENNPNDHH